jgi:hypothetical protein
MPRYYFHLTDGDLFEPDDLGQPLPDDASALAEARRFLKEVETELYQPGTAFVSVVDRSGREVGVVRAAPPSFRPLNRRTEQM